MEASNTMLKYFFTAFHEDGKIVRQTPEDVSLTKPGGSAFSDVDLDTVIRFELISDYDIWAVDLRDGHFEHNGIPFIVHDQHHIVNTPLRLVYFRECRAEHDVNPRNGETVGEPRHYINRYFFGWQTTRKGKNIKHTIGIV